jgi:hypothetical protein
MIENKLLLKALFRSLGSSLGLAFALTPAVSLAGVVSSPTNGSTMSSPFSLVASQTTCEGQNVASMGYSIDGGSTTIINGTSMNTNVSASTGSHVLHVKSWGPYQASCDTDVNITVSAAPAPGVTSL